MLNIAICDDELFERERTKELIIKYAVRRQLEINVDVYTSGDEFLKHYEKGKYSIIFMDVEMNSNDGIVTADKIRRIPDHDVIIIYVSNYPEYMQQSFDVRAAQFFSKPLNYELFESKLDKLFEYINEEKDIKICFHKGTDKYIVSVSDILLIETESIIGSNSNLKVKTVGEVHKIKGKLKEYEEKYKKYFVSPNRSCIVNIERVSKIIGDEIELDNGIKVHISRNRITDVKQRFMERIRKEMKR